MRKIKFRGKRIDNGEWVYGDLLKIAGGALIYYGHQIDCDELEEDSDIAVEILKNEVAVVNPRTVGQFTGLYDDDGKGIYEGDIFQVKAYEPKYEVYFADGMFQYCQIGSLNRRPMFLRRINIDSYVIGNIHDNPELLKGGEQ